MPCQSIRPIILFICISLAEILFSKPTDRQYLDDYLFEKSADYKWTIHSMEERKGYKYVLLKLQSGKWLTTAQLGNEVWEHWLKLGIPKKLSSKNVLLDIGGGNRNDPPPKELSTTSKLIMEKNKIIVGELTNIPNQPITFKGTERARKEDQIIAWQWRKFIDDPHATLDSLPRLPMIRAVIRAMDSVQKFMAKNQRIQVKSFILSGESKRGWTVWLASVLDQRVIGLIPMVAEILNFDENMNHHYSFYNKNWSFVMKDYLDLGVDKEVIRKNKKPGYLRLTKILDPINYPKLQEIPKYMISASKDEFFVPNSWKTFRHKLKKNAWTYMVPNVGHELRNKTFNKEEQIASSMAVFIGKLNNNALNELPTLEFSYLENSILEMTSTMKPASITLWEATNTNVRDFRNTILTANGAKKGPNYLATDIPSQKKLTMQIKKPEKGFKAYFIEVMYKIHGMRFFLSSKVRIIENQKGK